MSNKGRMIRIAQLCLFLKIIWQIMLKQRLTKFKIAHEKYGRTYTHLFNFHQNQEFKLRIFYVQINIDKMSKLLQTSSSWSPTTTQETTTLAATTVSPETTTTKVPVTTPVYSGYLANTVLDCIPTWDRIGFEYLNKIPIL